MMNKKLDTFLNKNRTQPQILEKKQWAALLAIDGIGPVHFYKIYEYLKQTQITWPQFWANQSQVWQKIGLNEKTAKSIKKFKKEYTISECWRRLTANNISVVSWQNPQYPPLLKKISQPPPILFVKGNIELCRQLPIAIVGTRHPTAYGKLITKRISQDLAHSQATVISGFMYGVDVLAQTSAVDVGGCTVGVLGSGFNHIYPRNHARIMERLLKTDKAVFISEFPAWVRPTRGTFPRRNRIIAALSLGVVVTEAGPKSGTQITVGYALDYGRDVFAVSGPVTSPFHLGVKKILNQGAVLVSDGQDVLRHLSALNWSDWSQHVNLSFDSKQRFDQLDSNSNLLHLTSLQQQILQTISASPLTTQDLFQEFKIQIGLLNQALTDLEIKGLIICEANQWRLVD
jgi:DNA processing protein